MLPKSHLAALQASVYPKKAPVRPKDDAQVKEIVLAKVAAGLSPSAAAKSAGLRLSELKLLAQEDEAFAKDITDAYDQGSDYLEDLALVRAHESDTVLLKLLEARRPEKFSNKRLVNAGVKIVINSLSSKPDEQIQSGSTQIQIEGQAVEVEEA